MTPWHRHDLTQTEWLALPLWVRVSLCLALYVGYRYGPSRVPFDGPGIPSSLVTPVVATVVCSPLTASIVLGCFPDAAWVDGQDWLQLVVGDAGRPWSPIECAVDAGVGVEVAKPDAPGVYLVQGWRELPSAIGTGHGHAFLLRHTGDPTGVMERIHATSSGKLGPTRGRVRWIELVQRYSAGLRVVRLRERAA